MKQGKILSIFFLLSLGAFIFSSCDKDEESNEVCTQEEICPDNDVTACCDGATCYYTFDGTRYEEDQLEELTDALGCTGGTNGRSDEATQLEEVKSRLLDLIANTRAELQ